MKAIICASVVLLFATQSIAQTIEVSAYATAGLSHYVGNYATATAYIGPSISGRESIDKRDNNPYGSKRTFSNSFGAQGQFISKQGIIGGLQIGIENLRSEVHIDEYKGTYPQTFSYDATSTLARQFLNINPYVGYRILLNNVKIDLMPGLDIGLSMSGIKRIKSDDTGRPYLAEERVKDIPVDYRLRFGSAIYYNRIGLVASYSRGLKNYVAITKGSQTAEAKSEVMRLGLTYRFY